VPVPEGDWTEDEGGAVAGEVAAVVSTGTPHGPGSAPNVRELAPIPPTEAQVGSEAAQHEAADDEAADDEFAGNAAAACAATVSRVRTRATVAQAIVRATDGEEQAAPQRLCEELVAGCGLRGAMVVSLAGKRGLRVIGADGLFADLAVQAQFAARDAVARLHDQMSRGAALVHEDAFPVLPAGLVVAVAPVSSGTRLVGALLLAAPEGEDLGAVRAAALAIATELADAGRCVLFSPREQMPAEAVRRARLTQLLEAGAFTPHFQPIMELGTNRAIGYEALTRWHDRSDPGDVLAEAHALGLGADVEVGLAAAAIEHGKELPPGAYLALNFSVSTVLTRPDIELLLPKDRPVVIEITENERVDDHEALRRALARLGPNVHVAVDDAGASYASLRHIVSVRPRCVKLDIYWITDIDSDPARQAVLAGLVHLSNKLGRYLVAEGIERQSELLALRQLGITHGQGALLGRPRSAGAYTRRPLVP
jgi:EAL domain-containing protein (putative c-di-GMP-specific phosphodiesterase class I)